MRSSNSGSPCTPASASDGAPTGAGLGPHSIQPRSPASDHRPYQRESPCTFRSGANVVIDKGFRISHSADALRRSLHRDAGRSEGTACRRSSQRATSCPPPRTPRAGRRSVGGKVAHARDTSLGRARLPHRGNAMQSRPGRSGSARRAIDRVDYTGQSL
jgi:hypothetical protein